MAVQRTEKSTIPSGKNPLANVSYSQTRPPIENLIQNTVKDEAKSAATGEAGAKSAEKTPSADKPEPVRKDKVTVLLPEDLIERLRNAAWWERKTLATIAEDGIRRAVERLEKEHGGPFETRGEEKLKTGRPQKTSSAKTH
jgi:hypothetical protein